MILNFSLRFFLIILIFSIVGFYKEPKKSSKTTWLNWRWVIFTRFMQYLFIYFWGFFVFYCPTCFKLYNAAYII